MQESKIQLTNIYDHTEGKQLRKLPKQKGKLVFDSQFLNDIDSRHSTQLDFEKSKRKQLEKDELIKIIEEKSESEEEYEYEYDEKQQQMAERLNDQNYVKICFHRLEKSIEMVKKHAMVCLNAASQTQHLALIRFPDCPDYLQQIRLLQKKCIRRIEKIISPQVTVVQWKVGTVNPKKSRWKLSQKRKKQLIRYYWSQTIVRRILGKYQDFISKLLPQEFKFYFCFPYFSKEQKQSLELYQFEVMRMVHLMVPIQKKSTFQSICSQLNLDIQNDRAYFPKQLFFKDQLFRFQNKYFMSNYVFKAILCESLSKCMFRSRWDREKIDMYSMKQIFMKIYQGCHQNYDKKRANRYEKLYWKNMKVLFAKHTPILLDVVQFNFCICAYDNFKQYYP